MFDFQEINQIFNWLSKGEDLEAGRTLNREINEILVQANAEISLKL